MNRGARLGEAFRERAERSLRQAGIPLAAAELVAGDALRGRVRRAIDDGAGLIVVGGGDGTLRLAAEEMRGTGAVLGILPLGTGNNLARDLHLPLDLPGAVAALVRADVRVIDLGEAEMANGDRHAFINAAHVGLLGRINPRMSDHLKRRYGRWAYLHGAWNAGRDFQPFHFRIETGGSVRNWRILHASAIMGRSYAGGAGEIPGEALDDHRMTLTVLEADSPHRLLATVMRLRRSRRASGAKAHRFRLSEFSVDADPPHEINLDGEVVGETPATLRVRSGSLRVVSGDAAGDGRVHRHRARWLAAGAVSAVVIGEALRRRRAANEAKKQLTVNSEQLTVNSEQLTVNPNTVSEANDAASVDR